MVANTEEMQVIYDSLIGYRESPKGFFRNVLGIKEEYIWPKMIEVVNSVRDHQLTAVRACHSVSKTYTSGRIVPWFKTCFQPSTIVTTAPSDNQVRNQLWKEIHAAYSGARVPLGGKMTTLQWNVKPKQSILDELEPEQREQWEKNFAIGFATSADSATEHATKMQGWHNKYFLALMDEACGIIPQIWRTIMEGLIINERCKALAIGNPTDPECDFAKACYSSDPEKQEGSASYISDEGWHVITISVYDTPNYKQNREVIPGLAGRAYVKRIIKKYGPNGDGTRIRVRGLFPTHKEGTYYGARLAKAHKEGRVGNFGHVPGTKVYSFNDTGDMHTATLFVQFLRTGVRIIDDYWDNEGLGIPNLAKVCQDKGYVYGGHFSGPELASGTPGRFQTGKATKDISAELGMTLKPILRHSFNDGIEATRNIWPQLEINKLMCPTFLKAAAGYGKKKNEALSSDSETVYHDQPAKTWHRHMMDALRHLAMAFFYMTIGEDILGQNETPYEQHGEDMDKAYREHAWV